MRSRLKVFLLLALVAMFCNEAEPFEQFAHSVNYYFKTLTVVNDKKSFKVDDRQRMVIIAH